MRNFHPASGFSLAFRLALIGFFPNLAIEASVVFLPLYAESVGSSRLMVGFIAASYGLAYFVSSILFGRLSDVHGRLIFIRLGLALSAIAFFTQIIAQSPVSLLVTRGFVGFCTGMTTATAMAYIYESQKQVGKFASYGALGWLSGAAIAAIIRDFQPMFLTSAVATFIAFMFSLTLKEEKVSRIPVAIIPLSTLKKHGRIYFPLLIRQLGGYAIWTIFPLYLSSIGASKLWIALLDVINMSVQTLMMRIMERFNPAKTFQAGLVISTVVFALYGVATNYLQVVPIQVVLAVSWSCLFIGAFSYLFRHSEERGTASGLLYSTINFSAGVGPFIGGSISQAWGFPAVMYFASGATLVSWLFSRKPASRNK